VVVVPVGTLVVVDGAAVVVVVNVVVLSAATSRVVLVVVAADTDQLNESVPSNTPPTSTTRNLDTGVVTARKG